MVDQQFAEQQTVTPFGLEKPLITRLLQAQAEAYSLARVACGGNFCIISTEQKVVCWVTQVRQIA